MVAKAKDVPPAVKAPQAQNDVASTTEGSAALIDVLSNDRGGSAVQLYSLDQQGERRATADGTWVTLPSGARIRIVSGQIEYDVHGAFDYLREGQTATDSFTYSVRMGNGVTSTATVTVSIAGAADANQIKGVVTDGYIAGATIFVDVNGDGVKDGDEPSATTDASGAFTINTELSGPLVVIGGTNVDTGLANLLMLTAPVGATVVNPLTTLVQALVESGSPAPEAEALVKAALGLNASLDLLTTDILGDAASDPAALAAQKAAVSVAALLLGAQSYEAGSEVKLLDAIVTELQSSGALNLTSVASVEALYAAALPDAIDLGQLVSDTVATTTAIEAASGVSDIAAIQLTPPVDENQVEGTAGNDEFLAGTDGRDRIKGLGGDDFLDGASRGDDVIDGGDGRDYVYLDFSKSSVGVEFKLGIDTTVQSGAGGRKTLVSIEAAELFGSNHADKLSGGSFTDDLYGGVGDDELAGGDGDDTLSGDEGRDHLIGGSGNDFMSGGAGDDILEGGAGDDVFVGEFDPTQAGTEIMRGGDGNDRFSLGAGSYTIDGGEGDDVAQLPGLFSAYRIDRIDAVTHQATAISGDFVGATYTLTDVERISFGDGTAFTPAQIEMTQILGTPADNQLRGTAGNDFIQAGAGNDDIELSGGGFDVADGGAGNDYALLDFGYATDSVLVSFIQDEDGRFVGTASQGATAGVHNIESFDILGSAFGDILEGANGTDYLLGRAGDDLLFGGGGDDELEGGAGNDMLDGGLGRDIIRFGIGDDGNDIIIEFDPDQDRLQFTNLIITDWSLTDLNGDGENESMRASYISADPTKPTSGTVAIEHLQSVPRYISHFYGTAANETFAGTSGDDVILGNGGFDTFDANTSGTDLLIGGPDRDTVRIDFRSATQDPYFVFSGNQTVLLNGGFKTFVNLDSAWIEGSEVADHLVGGMNSDDIFGNGGDDTLDGREGADVVRGGSGNDQIYGGDGNDLLIGDAGGDWLIGEAGADTFIGESGVGATTSEIMWGGTGDDRFYVFAGTNSIDGGDGADTLYLTGSVANYEVTRLDALTFRINVVAGPYNSATYRFTGIERVVLGDETLVFAPPALNEINGTAAGEELTGTGGDDYVRAGAGDDFLDAYSAGFDVLDGGAGYDLVWLDFSSSSEGVTVAFNGNQNVLSGPSGVKTLVDIEAAEFFGSIYNDTFFGGASDDILFGNEGNDLLVGGAGDDYFYGGSGQDEMVGGSGHDIFEISGFDGNDIITDFTPGEDTLRLNQAVIVSWAALDRDGDGTNDAIQLAYDYETSDIPGSGGTVTLLGLTTAPTIGYVIHGTSGNDNLFGTAGDDFLSGNIGDDRLDGTSPGRDTLHGGPGTDTVVLNFAGLAAGVTFAIAGASSVDTPGGAKELISLEVADIVGSAFDDTLTGGSGADVLKGGLGQDTLSGGAGADTFVYTSPAESTGLGFDKLVGFSFAEDFIDLPGVHTAQIGGAFGYEVRTANFNADIARAVDDLLQPYTAATVAATGDYDGRRFLVVDADGDGSYVAGSDYLFELVAPVDWVVQGRDLLI